MKIIFDNEKLRDKFCVQCCLQTIYDGVICPNKIANYNFLDTLQCVECWSKYVDIQVREKAELQDTTD